MLINDFLVGLRKHSRPASHFPARCVGRGLLVEMPRTSWVGGDIRGLLATLDVIPIVGNAQHAHIKAVVENNEQDIELTTFRAELISSLGTVLSLAEGKQGLLPCNLWALPLLSEAAPFAYALTFRRVELSLVQVNHE